MGPLRSCWHAYVWLVGLTATTPIGEDTRHRHVIVHPDLQGHRTKIKDKNDFSLKSESCEAPRGPEVIEQNYKGLPWEVFWYNQ
jgi:hypothetical protein